MPATHHYELFGLHVASELVLPELVEAAPRSCDVAITVGAVRRPSEPGSSAQVADGGITLVCAPAARFHIRDGAHIRVDATPGANPGHVRLFLLGSALGILIHQRGLLPLHANAVEIGGRAVAFSGTSGAGKSTLAAWFHDRGQRIVADDICVLDVDAEQAIARPGIPRFRLWRDALERSGRRPSDHALTYAGDESYAKFDVATRVAGVVDKPLPLSAVYLLERGEEFAIERLQGLEAVEGIFANTYRGAYISLVESSERHWRACLRLVENVPIYRLRRSWSLTKMDEQNEALRFALEPVAG